MHLLDEGPDGIIVFATTIIDVAANVISDRHRSKVIGTEKRGIERIREGNLLSGLQVERIGSTYTSD